VSLALEDRSVPRPYQKRRDADLAWSEFRGDRLDDRVPEAAKREVRNFKRSLEASAQAIGAAMRGTDWRGPAGDYFYKKNAVGRTRALLRLKHLFRGASVQVRDLGAPLGEAVLIKWLAPTGPLMALAEPSFQQESVIVHLDALVRWRQSVVSVALIPLEAPDHCLGRFFQRGGVDALGALNEAASWFLSLPVRDVIELSHERGESLILPAGDGVFLSNVIWGKIRGTTGWRLMARPRTWIRSSQAGQDQRPLAPAADVASSVLAAGFALSGKLPGMPSPLTDAELEQLEADLVEGRGL